MERSHIVFQTMRQASLPNASYAPQGEVAYRLSDDAASKLA